jgi:carbon-monoxide dehydrogenase large subunit
VTFAQIAADRLGVGLDSIVLRFGDSEVVPPGVGTFGSRSTAVAGSAVLLAVDQLLEQGRQLVAHLLGFAPAAVGYTDGRFSAGGRDVEWTELARFAHDEIRLPPGIEVGLEVSARFDSELVFSSGAYAAVIGIDAQTGKLTVHRVVGVDDAGTIINPQLAHGQIVGGAVQGLGECVVEEVIYDEDGQLRTATFVDYGLLTAPDVPEIVTGEVSSPSPRNPLGAKGVGEGGTIGTLPAVANAVADALGGVRVDPPYTAEKLWRALRKT